MTIASLAQLITAVREHRIQNLIRRPAAVRRILWTVAAAAFATGLMFRWNWLVAAGVAPILVSLLPCAVMCAFGFCAYKAASPTPAKQSQADPKSSPKPSEKG